MEPKHIAPKPDLRQEIQKLVREWDEKGKLLKTSLSQHPDRTAMERSRAVTLMACARELERLLS
jgi:phosphate uptake regulator